MTSFKFLFDLYMSEFLSCKSYQQFSISGLIQFYNEVIDNKGSEATPTDAYKTNELYSQCVLLSAKLHSLLDYSINSIEKHFITV